ncbi:hypothetical protein [Salarchaeum sp. JOR-1]|uniref:hypothetical protein n=1 Tax=Salarchaeum sp. JOR-1 TaxID=2599399 RepID=UPI001198A5E4|nr:hypothetical protein [Salarchaeum sp. JOR-1]QDX41510.1 hypothetical protein FQU85_11580 [Salarchaeum sp. JOR-1]
MSRRALLALALLLVAAGVAAPVAARPPPEDVDGFPAFTGDRYDYPESGVTNVSVTVAVAANGTSAWTERATLANRKTADAFRENATLRRLVTDRAFDHRFGHATTNVHARLDGDTLVVTYRLDGVVHTGPGGGVLFAPFAGYGNDYRPDSADVTIHAPVDYRVTDAPTAMTVRGDTVRWNDATGTGAAGVSPGLVTFAPDDAALPGLRGELAVAATYGPTTLRTAAGGTLLYGPGFGLLLAGLLGLSAALLRTPSIASSRESLERAGFVGVLVALFAWLLVENYPDTGVVPGVVIPWWFVALIVTLPAGVVGVALLALARRYD